MGRWIAVRFLAWSLRDGRHGHQRISKSEAREALGRAFPRRDYDWREQLLEEAQRRNARTIA